MTNIMTEDQFILLLQGFRQRRLSEEDLLSFLKAAEDPRFESLIDERLQMELVHMKASPVTDEHRAGKVWQQVRRSMGASKIKEAETGKDLSASEPVRPVRSINTSWLRYAAAAVLLLAAGYWLLVGRGNKKPDVTQSRDIAPGHDGAILTLADGRKIVLDSLANGVVAQQNGSKVELNNGSLQYDASHSPFTIDHSRLAYNTLSTPRGRQFQLMLPDGSKVWLNAASSITYPTAFAGNERRVKITGEVYFEVAPSTSSRTGARTPFIVDVDNRSRVEVLGTHFNINSYADEDAIKTTLLEGKVKVSATGSRLPTNDSRLSSDSRLLTPGQQAIVTDHITVTDQISIDQIMAWKNGLFNFQDESLEEVMKQLERWYDIKVKYIGDPPKQKFFGELGRDLTLAQVIEALREIGIQFNIEGRTLIVSH